MIRGLVFDMDDTLYLERDYVRSGLDHVARFAATTEEDARSLSSWLWDAFESGIRGDTFDRLRGAFPEVAGRFSTHDLIGAYRAHEPSIELLAGVEETLGALRRRGVRLGVVSDGPPVSQGAKARALELERWFDPIILTGALGEGYAKPATAAFERISQQWGIADHALAYVADNPEKDFAGPRRLGWTTIRLRDQRQLRFALEPTQADSGPDLEIRTPAELLGVVGQLGPLRDEE